LLLHVMWDSYQFLFNVSFPPIADIYGETHPLKAIASLKKASLGSALNEVRASVKFAFGRALGLCAPWASRCVSSHSSRNREALSFTSCAAAKPDLGSSMTSPTRQCDANFLQSNGKMSVGGIPLSAPLVSASDHSRHLAKCLLSIHCGHYKEGRPTKARRPSARRKSCPRVALST